MRGAHAELVRVTGWDIEDDEGGSLFALTTGDGREARVRVSPSEAGWFRRSLHPSYRHHLVAFSERLSERALCVEIRSNGEASVTVDLIFSSGSRISSEILPLTCAVHIGTHSTVPVLVDPSLFGSGVYKELDLVDFRSFIDVVPADAFEVAGG